MTYHVTEKEFEQLYKYLLNDLPLVFNSHGSNDSFAVSPEFDGEPIASFLMTHDEFNGAIPLSIQLFLNSLTSDWVVFGSFDIRTPFLPDGTYVRSPRFVVTKTSVDGEIDMEELKKKWGEELKDSRDKCQ